MKYALLAFIIACWSVVAFVYRGVGRKSLPQTWVALAASLVWFVLNLAASAARDAAPLDAPPVLLAVGALGGLGCAASLPFFMGAVARGNLAVSWTILTLSFAAASLVSLVYPGAAVTAAGVAGLAAAGLAIVFLGRDGARSGASMGFRRGWGLFMTAAFAANAVYLYAYPLAGAWASLEPLSNKMAMLLAETGVFFVGSAAICALRRARRGKPAALGAGAAIGAMFFAGNYATMAALGDLAIPAYVLFPATTGGSTIVVALVSAAVFGERPGVTGWVGLALGLAAMVLLGAVA